MFCYRRDDLAVDVPFSDNPEGWEEGRMRLRKDGETFDLQYNESEKREVYSVDESLDDTLQLQLSMKYVQVECGQHELSLLCL
jgi:hypothetical protein